MTMTNQLRVLCHDNRNMIDATLERISDAGCELTSREKSVLPTFPTRACVVLNVFCELNGQQQTIPVRLMGAARVNGRWTYKVAWERRPAGL